MNQTAGFVFISKCILLNSLTIEFDRGIVFQIGILKILSLKDHWTTNRGKLLMNRKIAIILKKSFTDSPLIIHQRVLETFEFVKQEKIGTSMIIFQLNALIYTAT